MAAQWGFKFLPFCANDAYTGLSVERSAMHVVQSAAIYVMLYSLALRGD